MKLLQFIVVDEQLRDGKNLFTVTGECYMPVGKQYPVIRRNSGCIGLGTVKSVLITQNSTEIEFNLTRDISKETKKAFYDLYRNNVSVHDSNSDPYENTDQVIPGAMVTNTKKKSSFGDSSRYRDYRTRDDDYDDGSLTGAARRMYGYEDY